MKRNLFTKFLGFLFISFCIGGSIWGVVRQYQLKKNNKLAIAKIVDFRSEGRGNAGGIWIDFILNVEYKTFKGESRINKYYISDDDFIKHFLGKTFPAAYNPKNPNNSSVLITPKDFAAYGYTFPDSLKWVMVYFREK